MEHVVAVGEWLYDGNVPTLVRVVRLDYDFWFAVGEADGDLQRGERPALNPEGFCYYVRHKPGWSAGQPFWPDSVGHLSVTEAMRDAESKVPGSIRWE